MSLPSFGQSNNTSNPPLDDSELREVLTRLYELKASWQEISVLNKTIERLQYLQIRENGLASKELEIERQRTELAIHEREQVRKEMEFYKGAYESLVKRRRCLKKLLSLGFARCG